MIGPGQLERDAVADRAQPVEALELREAVGETHVVELAHRAGREAVAARLLAGEALLVDHDDTVAERREPVRGRRSRRSGADHEHVELHVRGIAHDAMITRPEPKNRTEHRACGTGASMRLRPAALDRSVWHRATDRASGSAPVPQPNLGAGGLARDVPRPDLAW